jgi:tetratricopeptide (TPR) repeat protein
LSPTAKELHHDETIVPVEPGLLGKVSQPPASDPRRERRGRIGLAGLSLAGLLTVALAVFVALPRWVADDAPETPTGDAPAEPAAAPATEPALSAEELAALQAQADTLLASLLTQQDRLERQQASDWAGAEWERYGELGRAGDDAYLAKAFDEAVSAYQQALRLGEALIARAGSLLERALAAGQQALEAGNAALAMQQFELVLKLEPEHTAASTGLERARRLPEVLALVERGRGLENEDDLAGAADAYRQALGIDPDWAAARSLLAAVDARRLERRFEARMSEGLTALAAGDFEAAEAAFDRALLERPGSKEARDGVIQAQQGRKLDEIALMEARGLAFERRELWQQAIEQYQAALEADGTLLFAQQGLTRAQAGADLDAKLAKLIGEPNLLFEDRVLADARLLLDQARAVDPRGPRLAEQTAELDRLITLASTPVSVELRSDGVTEVTVYRVGPLGTFAAKTMELRPGIYTAVGSRHGYRDVRHTFTVVPGRPLEPVTVQCIEPI